MFEGDIVYMGVFGNPVVVVNAKQAAYDLLDRRSSIYSSRPERPMVTELYVQFPFSLRIFVCAKYSCRMGFGWMFSSMQYGIKWRAHRRLFHRHFNPTASANYRPLQVKETGSLLKSLLTNPQDYVQHVRRYAVFLFLCQRIPQLSPRRKTERSDCHDDFVRSSN